MGKRIHTTLAAGLVVILAASVATAAIFVEDWEQETLLDGPDDLDFWEVTYGSIAHTASNSQIRYIGVGGSLGMRLNGVNPYSLGITTTNGFPHESMVNLFAIRADIKIENDGTDGSVMIMTTQAEDVLTGYLLSIDFPPPGSPVLQIQRSNAGVLTTLSTSPYPIPFDVSDFHTYHLQGTAGANDTVVLRVFLDYGDNSVLAVLDWFPVEFQTHIKGGMLTLDGRSAIFDNCVASIAIPGDLTGDMDVDSDDIAGFVQTLLDPDSATYYERCAADMNEDVLANGADIQLFVNELVE